MVLTVEQVSTTIVMYHTIHLVGCQNLARAIQLPGNCHSLDKLSSRVKLAEEISCLGRGEALRLAQSLF